ERPALVVEGPAVRGLAPDPDHGRGEFVVGLLDLLLQFGRLAGRQHAELIRGVDRRLPVPVLQRPWRGGPPPAPGRPRGRRPRAPSSWKPSGILHLPWGAGEHPGGRAAASPSPPPRCAPPRRNAIPSATASSAWAFSSGAVCPAAQAAASFSRAACASACTM